MSAKKTSISIDERLYNDAQERFAEYYCSNFSEYVTALIREDMQKHRAAKTEDQHPSVLIDTPDKYKTRKPPSKRAS